MKKFSAMVMAAVLGSAFTIGCYQIFDNESSGKVKVEHVNTTPAVQAAYKYGAADDIAPLDFTVAAEKVMPAVVHIRSTQTATVSYSQRQQIPEEFREFFGPFLRQGQPERRPQMGTGSGVIVSEDGYIVTNNHVVENASEILVTLNDNRSYDAKVIGTDPTTDIALVKIEESGLEHLPLVNSDDVKVGEWVLAVGNPFNLNSTVTAGIVSAKGRSIGILQEGNVRDSANVAIESFIQTDAAVNPGNSGGALTNLNGDLVGINTAIASPTGAYSGYAFAVPSNIVSRVVNDLIEYGAVQRGWLGVSISNITGEFAAENGLEVVNGAYVRDLPSLSSAKDAGIKKGDVITEIDGRKIYTTANLIGYIGSKRPGDKVSITVNRYGEEKQFEVVLKNREGNTEVLKKEEKPEIMLALGAELEDLDNQTLDKLGIQNGVRINKLNAGKIRRETNMREGFIITKIDGKKVKSKEEVVDILKNKKGGVLIEGIYADSDRTYYYGLGV